MSRERLTGGFGLFSVRERLVLLGGSMEIQSAPGQGSRFILKVPGQSLESTDPAPKLLAPGSPSPQDHPTARGNG